MRIGILTLPLYYNYGGILQAYALQKTLVELGHEAIIINYQFKMLEPSLFSVVKRGVKKVFGKYNGYYIDFEKRYNKWLPMMKSQTSNFIQNNLVLSKPLSSYYDIRESDYDAIIVGSDQIWRPCMFQLDPSITYLSFAKGWKIKRISYAASFGTDVWEYSNEQTVTCGKLAKMFDAISVRESSGIRNCADHLGVSVEQVCDPTLLLEAKDYITLIEKSNTPKSEGNLFNYILDVSETKKTLIDYVAHDRNLIPFKVNANDKNIKCPIEKRIAKPVEAWLRGFYDADYIVTDSFHACVFSIIFRKPFVVVANKSRGLSRFETLLGSLGLVNRMIESIDDYNKLPKTIDYDTVCSKLKVEKEKSLDFLKRYF